MRFSLIFYIVSFMTLLCGIAMCIPGLVDFYNGQIEAAHRLFVPAGLTVGAGLITFFITHQEQQPLRPKEMFLTTTLVWLFFAVFSALPFYFSLYDVSFTDSFFESMSGLTTTGATIFSGLDTMNHGLLLWRSMIQWMGGVGIIVVAITVLPALHIGGMHFFTTESSDKTDRKSPKIAQNMHAILLFFIFLSLACMVSLWLAGMSVFDAINYAMTAVATGGFATKDASVGFYNNPAIEWILTFFMATAGLPLIIGMYLYKRHWRAIKSDDQIFTYLMFLICSIGLLSVYRWFHLNAEFNDLEDIIRSTAFNIVSVVTTTGYASENYGLWGNFAVVFFMFLLFTGACTGSTSGGIKMFRFNILFKTVIMRLKTMAQPHGVFIARYNNRPISDDVLIGVMVLITLFLLVATAATLALAFLGLDFMTALSGTVTSLSNVGPGLGPIIGPDKTFALLPSAAKWILAMCMLMGRLEFIAIVILTLPFMWRKNI